METVPEPVLLSLFLSGGYVFPSPKRQRGVFGRSNTTRRWRSGLGLLFAGIDLALRGRRGVRCDPALAPGAGTRRWRSGLGFGDRNWCGIGFAGRLNCPT